MRRSIPGHIIHDLVEFGVIVQVILDDAVKFFFRTFHPVFDAIITKIPLRRLLRPIRDHRFSLQQVCGDIFSAIALVSFFLLVPMLAGFLFSFLQGLYQAVRDFAQRSVCSIKAADTKRPIFHRLPVLF